MAAWCCIALPKCAQAQIVPNSYGNNPTGLHWQQARTDHFLMVFPERYHTLIPAIAEQAETIFDDLKRELGKAPGKKIKLYYNGDDEIVSGIHARATSKQFSIWEGNPLTVQPERNQGRYAMLRYEISYAFIKNIRSYVVRYYHYLKYPPANPPWPDGLLSYLADSTRSTIDNSFMRWYQQQTRQGQTVRPSIMNWSNSRLGRSQIQYFEHVRRIDALSTVYASQTSLFGIFPAFNFKPAFRAAANQSYGTFTTQWMQDSQQRYGYPNRSKKIAAATTRAIPADSASILNYSGAALNGTTDRFAFVGHTNGGNYQQTLYVSSDDSSRQPSLRKIRNGYFHPVMDWNAAGTKLAFSQRHYDSKLARFYQRLHIWDRSTGHTRLLRTPRGAQLPSFSPDGTDLAFVVQQATQKSAVTVWQQSPEHGSPQKLCTLGEAASVDFIDYSPNASKLLISYYDGQRHRMGLFDRASQQFFSFTQQSGISFHAQWAHDGETIFYNRAAEGVPAIFQAQLDGRSLHKIRLVIQHHTGALLWDVAASGNQQTKLLLKKGAAYATGHIAVAAIRAPLSTSGATTIKPITISKKPLKTPDQGQHARQVQPLLHFAKYHPFLHTQINLPITLPYYAGPDNIGFGTRLEFKEPMRTHAVHVTGIFSVTDPLHKSLFSSNYLNNSLGPRVQLNYNRFTDGVPIVGNSRKVRTMNVLALSSLWKLAGDASGSSWHAGIRLRYSSFDYLSDRELQSRNSHIHFTNKYTNQTDLKTTLTWRNLDAGRNTFVNPTRGAGTQFSITASDRILGSQTRYARFNLASYKILPAFSNHHIYLYANGIIDAGSPAGRDFLGFDNNGSIALPGPKFFGDLNPGVQKFVRGYNHTLLGDRLLFGQIEYRIPFTFNSYKKLLGFIPPARTVFTLFADGGVLGNARVSETGRKTTSRFSLGAEIKRVFTFSDFQFLYEFGLGKPLTGGVAPHPFVRAQMAIPF